MAPSTKQRRSRARRRASQRVVLQETVLAVEDATPEILTLVESSLVVVLEVRCGADVSLYIGGPGAPWVRREVRC